MLDAFWMRSCIRCLRRCRTDGERHVGDKVFLPAPCRNRLFVFLSVSCRSFQRICCSAFYFCRWDFSWPPISAAGNCRQRFPCQNGKRIYRSPGRCTVSLKNPTWLPIGTVTFFLSVENTTLHLGNQQEMQTSIAPWDTMQLEIPLVPSHCGQVRVTLHQCCIYDGIHLFSHRKRLNTSAVFTVLPGVPAPPVTDAGTQHGDATVMQPTTEPEEFLGVRDYRSGDRMRAIHWKLSSRFPEPVVREYGIPQKAPVAVGFLYVLPDGMQDPGSSLDAMLEALLAAVSYFCENGDCVTVILCRADQRRSETLTAANDLLPMLETLLESAAGYRCGRLPFHIGGIRGQDHLLYLRRRCPGYPG